MARVKGSDGNYVQQNDVSSIAYSVFDSEDTSTAIGTGTLLASAVIFNQLQTDNRWPEDETGYNFRWDIPATLLPAGDKVYRFEVKVTPNAAQAFHLVWNVSTEDLYRS